MMSVQENRSICSYWGPNICNHIIKNIKTVNMLEKIKQFLHFIDNNQLIPPNRPGHDRLHYIRSILETLKNDSSQFCKNKIYQ